MTTERKILQVLGSKAQIRVQAVVHQERWIAARTLYGMYARADSPMTPGQIAVDYDLPR